MAVHGDKTLSNSASSPKVGREWQDALCQLVQYLSTLESQEQLSFLSSQQYWQSRKDIRCVTLERMTEDRAPVQTSVQSSLLMSQLQSGVHCWCHSFRPVFTDYRLQSSDITDNRAAVSYPSGPVPSVAGRGRLVARGSGHCQPVGPLVSRDSTMTSHVVLRTNGNNVRKQCSGLLCIYRVFGINLTLFVFIISPSSCKISTLGNVCLLASLFVFQRWKHNWGYVDGTHRNVAKYKYTTYKFAPVSTLRGVFHPIQTSKL